MNAQMKLYKEFPQTTKDTQQTWIMEFLNSGSQLLCKYLVWQKESYHFNYNSFQRLLLAKQPYTYLESWL